MEISAFSGISGWGDSMIFLTVAGFVAAGLFDVMSLFFAIQGRPLDRWFFLTRGIGDPIGRQKDRRLCPSVQMFFNGFEQAISAFTFTDYFANANFLSFGDHLGEIVKRVENRGKIRAGSDNRRRSLKSIQAAHREIEDNQIGFEFQSCGNGIVAILGFTDAPTIPGLNHGPHQGSKLVVAISQQDSSHGITMVGVFKFEHTVNPVVNPNAQHAARVR
jgi:hypothetical protein